MPLVLLLSRGHADEPVAWTPRERRAIERLSLAALPGVPRDPSNAVADDPRAAQLGHRLFFDTGLSSNGRVSCASCHMPERGFQDDLPVGKGIGRTARRTMPLAGVAYAHWLFWDGRRDSLWAQALSPIESRVEHGITRTFAVRRIVERYRRECEAVFGKLPRDLRARLPAEAGPLGTPSQQRAWRRLTRRQQRSINATYANLGKAIEAYERLLRPAPSRFDRFAAALGQGDDARAARIFSPEEARGLRLFIGSGHCTNCHFGPLFTNGEFHNTGVPQTASEPDRGRADGARAVLRDPFNCLGRFSDASAADCSALRFIVLDRTRLLGSFKTPSLRDVASRSPYMHAGQLPTLRDVLQHYRRAAPAHLGRNELDPLGMSNRQLDDLVRFLRTLDGGIAAPHRFLRPPTP